jgi:DNA-binding MarR family transcriptional regulator
MKKEHLDNLYQTFTQSPSEIIHITLPQKIFGELKEMSAKQIASRFDLTLAELEVLATLHLFNNGLRAKEISQNLIFSSGGISKVVKKLLQKKLIREEVLPQDKRNYLLYNTEMGDDIMQKAVDLFEEDFKKFYNVLNTDELNMLASIYKKLLYNIAE